ncbi:MAG TPA: RNA-binding protein [Terriglobia bacterium]|nr:RNA-binding protein [Terriglobia bacterium]
MSRLFVGNIPHSCNDLDIQQWFENQGLSVDSVEIVRDRVTGHSRGFAFVEVGNAPDPKSVIEQLNGRRLVGRILTVGEAKPKTFDTRVA